MTSPTEEQDIRDGARVKAFLEDPLIAAAFARVDDRAIADIREAKSTESLVLAQAKLRALADVRLELRRVVDSGEHASTIKTQRERTLRPRA